jgi:catechol 2,3-dioxygenase-like lactoylglutathione lyase family enzyme
VPKLKHIAIAADDPDKTADFFMKVFDMKKLRTTDGSGHFGHILSDGNINLAALRFKTDAAAGEEFGAGYRGLHHIGFEVEDLPETVGKLTSNDGRRRSDIDAALGIESDSYKGEFKYSGPDGVMIDLSANGWDETSG